MLFNKETSRRKFLLGALVALPLSDMIFKGLTAAQAAEMAAPELNDYQPIFFNAEEWQFILAATDRLIPAGGKGKAPGALETNVPVLSTSSSTAIWAKKSICRGRLTPMRLPRWGIKSPTVRNSSIKSRFP